VSSKLQITPAECRLRAAECHKMGQNARRPHVRDTLAQTIVILAKQGECDPVRLEQRAIEIMAGQPPDLARST
jgi:hypothetical protein